MAEPLSTIKGVISMACAFPPVRTMRSILWKKVKGVSRSQILAPSHRFSSIDVSFHDESFNLSGRRFGELIFS